MKTLDTLMEESSGEITGIASPIALRHIKELAQQMSAAFQSTLPNTLNRINVELNKFGYTLGDLDLDTPFEDTGSDDYVIFQYAGGDPVKNAYINLEWRLLSSGQQFSLRTDGSELRYDVKIRVNLIDPNDFDTLINGMEGDLDVESNSIVEESVEIDSEEKKNLIEESYRVKKIGRTVEIRTDTDNTLDFTVDPSGAIKIVVYGLDGDKKANTSTITVPKNRAADFIDEIAGHYIQYTEK